MSDRGRVENEMKSGGNGGSNGVAFKVFDPDQFRGQVAIVTGGGKGDGAGGIGYNVVMAFARAGARLAIIGRTEEKLKKTVSDVEALGGEVIYVTGDVSDKDDLERLFAEVEKTFGRLDVLVNNAGLSGEIRALVRIPTRSFRYAFNVHLHTVSATRMAAKMMRRLEIKGTILNVGTYFTSPHRHLVRPYPFRTPYTTAQAWKLEYSRVSAWHLAKDGIRVIAINPGPVEGGRIDSIVYPLGALERGLWGRKVVGADIRRKTQKMHPAQRFLKQEEVAGSILSLVSKELRESANGSVVELSGGLDYRVPPQVAPPLIGGRMPDLKGQRVLMIGRADRKQATTMALAFAACRAQVLLATPDAGELLREMAEGRSPDKYSDGQKAILGRIEPYDIDPGDDYQVHTLFEKLTGNGNGDSATDPLAGEIDTVVLLTGEARSMDDPAEMTAADEERLRERFGFEPANLMRYGLTTLLLQGNRRAGVQDERFVSLESFMAVLERQRGVPGHEGGIERVPGGWTAEEETLLQTGTKKATGHVILIGPGVAREEADDAPMIGVVRSGLQSLVSTVAAETATGKAAIRVNAIFPGSESQKTDTSKSARIALRLAYEGNGGISGMVYYPDERNAVAGDPGQLAGQTAVVTGGGRNIGQAITLRLARAGARLVITGRGKVDLDLTARTVRALGGNAVSVTADVAFPGDRLKVLQAAHDISGRNGDGGVDLWVNNAGIGGTFATLDKIELDGDAGWHGSMAVNFTGAWLGMVRAIIDMRRRGVPGGVVNVSTYYADQPYVFRIPYTVPKVMLKACAATLANALRGYGLYITDIQPSLIDGPRFAWVAKNYAEQFRKHGVDDPESDPEIQEWFRRLVPTRAPGPDDVAQAVSFAAQRGINGSGQIMAVSTLDIHRPPAPPGGAELGGPGRTIVIVTTARTDHEIDRAGALAASCLEHGSKRVVMVADDEMLRRLGPGLSKRGSESPWWSQVTAAKKNGRMEIHGIDPTSASAVADFFEPLGKVDSVIYVPGSIDKRERFIHFPSDPDLTKWSEEDLEARYLEHQRALSLFIERHITSGLIVSREAVRALAPGGTLAISRAPGHTFEAILICEALRQIIRVAAEEFRLLGINMRAIYSHRTPHAGHARSSIEPEAAASA